jgi:hypothetical protein
MLAGFGVVLSLLKGLSLASMRLPGLTPTLVQIGTGQPANAFMDVIESDHIIVRSVKKFLTLPLLASPLIGPHRGLCALTQR